MGKRKSLGLALAGGVARGLAHVGVIQALEEAGIEADYVSGVSVGAIVGACYAAGFSAAQLVSMAHAMNWARVAQPSLLNPFRRGLTRLGVLDFLNLELSLIGFIGDVTFEELLRPFAVGATDLVTAEPVTISSGRVAPAVRASSSIPGVAVPTRWQGRLLCDGFISNNIPIQIMRNMGAEVVVAVNIMPVAREVSRNFIWAASSAISGLILRASDHLGLADVVVEPDLVESSYLWLAAEDYIMRGRVATQRVLPQLIDLLE